MDNKTLVNNHKGSLWKLLKIYNTDGALYKGKLLWMSIVLDCLFVTIVVAFKLDGFDLIKKFTDLYITILPSLLGFNLGAYALLIGLASSDLMQKMSRAYQKKFTTFQRASSVFGFCVLVEAVALIISFLFKMEILVIESSTFHLPDVSKMWLLVSNASGLLVLNFFGIYSIVILISVIRSIFAISQAAHFYAVTKQIKDSTPDKTQGTSGN